MLFRSSPSTNKQDQQPARAVPVPSPTRLGRHQTAHFPTQPPHHTNNITNRSRNPLPRQNPQNPPTGLQPNAQPVGPPCHPPPFTAFPPPDYRAFLNNDGSFNFAAAAAAMSGPPPVFNPYIPPLPTASLANNVNQSTGQPQPHSTNLAPPQPQHKRNKSK